MSIEVIRNEHHACTHDHCIVTFNERHSIDYTIQRGEIVHVNTDNERFLYPTVAVACNDCPFIASYDDWRDVPEQLLSGVMLIRKQKYGNLPDEKSTKVVLCLRGHGELADSYCPDCDDELPPRFIPMRTVEYDLSFSGGNYKGTGTTIFIPEAMIQETEEEAFEKFTGFHRSHIVSIRSDEEDELSGEELTQRIAAIEEQQNRLFKEEGHYKTCQLCKGIRMQARYPYVAIYWK